MLRIAVCDDDIEMAGELSAAIEKIMSNNNVEAKIYLFTDGYDMIESHIKFNLIFLDIEMPRLNGLETAKKIRNVDSHVQIVYVTNYHDYWRKAYSVHAFDYIQKPIEYASIHTVICDYLKTLSSDIDDVVEFTKEDSEKILLNSNEIILISSGYKKRTVAVVTSENAYLCKGTITDIYEILDDRDFFIPFRGYIINISKVKSFKRNDKIIMIDGDEVPLSKSNTEVFEKRLAKKMHEKVNKEII